MGEHEDQEQIGETSEVGHADSAEDLSTPAGDEQVEPTAETVEEDDAEPGSS